jgi:hypothetical protein
MVGEMKETSPLLELPYGLDTTTAYLTHQLANAGLRAAKVFELESACASILSNFHCPHSDDSPCSCELRVLHVQNDRGSRPVCLILHAHHEQAQVYLDYEEDGIQNTEIELLVCSALSLPNQ